MTQLAQAQPKADFRIPPPAATAPAQPQAPQPGAPSAAPPARQPGTAAPPFKDLWRPPSTTEIAIGAGILAVLAIVFLFVRNGVKNHLRDRRAPIDAASAASWTLFAALLLTALVAVSATIGNLWGNLLVTGPALVVCLGVFALFFIQFTRAPRRAR